MLTEKMLRDICARVAPGSHPLQSYLTAFTSPSGLATLERYQINTPLRVAAFFANVCEETGGLTVIRENMNYVTASRIKAVWPKRFTLESASRYVRNARALANTVYGGRLGNEDDGTNDDDGFDYRGGGPLQATGKGFYRFLKRETGIDFVTYPQEIENPEHWVEVACLTWRKHPSAGDLNVFADNGNFLGCCLGINYGNGYAKAKPIGWEERQKWHRGFTAALVNVVVGAGAGATASASADAGVFRIGSPYDAAVKSAQARLNALGYGRKALVEDGLYGPNTFSAVSDFQHINGMTMTGVMDASVLASIMSSSAKPWPVPAEAVSGIDGLRKAGDAQIVEADKSKRVAIAIGGAAVVDAAQKTGMLDFATELSKDATAWQAALSALTAVVKFCLANFTVVVLILVAVFLYRRYGTIVLSRVSLWMRPKEIGSSHPQANVGSDAALTTG